MPVTTMAKGKGAAMGTSDNDNSECANKVTYSLTMKVVHLYILFKIQSSFSKF